ncbi:collagen binding domain-containing protein [Paenibacillus sp. YIM B09110]|uniref:collagen binding domain-containing protein n=1 Tax=Paenibacillus sp. YIM B09110 TaxID=3126102 RepID=UPI00301B95C6
MKKKVAAMLVAFFVIFQYVNIGGITKQANALAIADNIITSITLSDVLTQNVIAIIDQAVSEASEDIQVELGQRLNIEYTYKLDASKGFQDGDTYEFQLPSELVVYTPLNDKPLDDGDGGTVGTFDVDLNGKVTMTFNENIVGSDVEGSLSFWTFFSKASVNNKTEVPVEFSIGDEVIIHIKPNVSKSTTKDGSTDKAINAQNISWSIDVNKTLKKVTNAKISDVIPTGLTFTNDGTLTLEKLDIDTDGVASNPVLVDPTQYNVTAPAAPDNELVIELGDIHSAYRVTYSTSIDSTHTNTPSFTNNVNFTGDNINPTSATKKIDNKRGELLKKTSTGYSETTQLVDWQIKYNFGENTIDPASITDLFDNKHKLVGGSINVYEVPDPNTGAKGSLVPADDYTAAAHNAAGKNGFIITFDSEISSAYIIEYQTEPTANVYKNETINNDATTDGGSASGSRDIVQKFFTKSNSGFNYATRTIEWSISINGNGYELYDLLFDDTFGIDGQKLDASSMRIDGETVADSTYTVNYKPDNSATDTVQGFSIDFGDGNQPHAITYTTKYDYADGSYATNKSSYTNTGGLKWKEEENGTELSKTANSDPVSNLETRDNGFKNGRYYADTKEIVWEVGINYNSKTLPNALVTDKLTSKQKYVANSLEVRHMTVAANGSTNTNGAIVDPDLYTLTVEDDADGQNLIVDFGNITSPYYLTFRTELEDEFIDDKNIENNAILTADGYDPKTLSETVQIPKAGEYVAKSGDQNDSDPNVIDWTVYINRGQSTVENASIIDTPSSKQVIVDDSFVLYDTSVDEDGNVTKAGPTDASLYEVNVETNPDPDAGEGDSIFTLTFKSVIKKPYILEYKTIIDAEDGDSLANSVAFRGNGVDLVTIEEPSEVEVKLSGGAGTGSAYKGSLKITKVDSSNNAITLAGAAFELYRASNNQKVGDTEYSGNDGIVQFNNLKYGQYTLKEVTPPVDYSIVSTGEYTITINSKGVQEITIANAKLTGDLTVTKVAAGNADKLLANAVFDLYDSTMTTKLQRVTTDAAGKAVFVNIPYGDYILKEYRAPSGYKIDGEGEYPITINEDNEAFTVANQKRIIVPEPEATPSPTPVASPEPTPVVTPAPTPSATPVPSETPSPTTKPSSTPPIEKEITKEEKPIEDKVDVPKNGHSKPGKQPENGKVTVSPDGKWVYTPNPGFIGKDKFSIIVTNGNGEEEELFFEIDVEEIPQGGLEGTPQTPDVDQLPKTGESSNLPFMALGVSLVLIGAALRLNRKSN